MPEIEIDLMRQIEITLLTMVEYAANKSTENPSEQQIRLAEIEDAEKVMDQISAWIEKNA